MEIALVVQPGKTMKIPTLSIQQLLEAGVHLGHKTLRWNPKMKKYIFGKRDSIHIIDLTQTLELTKVALEKVYETISNNGKILFVSTKKQASEAIAEVAKETDQYFVNYRWLGGMLTNWGTISGSIKKMKKYEADLVAENRGFTKKELLKMSVKKDKLERSLGGISEMKKTPDLIFSINDMWIINEQYKQIQDMHKDGRFKFVGYVPMDSYNWVACLTDTANDWDGIVSYTEFGAREFIKAGIEKPIAVIPHGVTEGQFYPIDKKEARKKLKLDDDLIKMEMNVNSDIVSNSYGTWLDTGSPHLVIEKDNIDKLDVNNEGRLIRYNDFYKKEGVNVNFIEKISDDQFKIRTYERGVENETLACGTGSTASAICMNFLGRTKSGKITMKCRGGDLNVQFNSSNNGFEEISITGPAKLVFDGIIKVKV